jgi:hypothetical protein
VTSAYCSPQDVRDSLRGTSTDGEGTAAELSNEQLQIAIEQASGLVTVYAGTEYGVDAWNPSVTVPQLIWSLTLDISCYYATLMYRKGKSLDDFDPVYLRYQAARATFMDLTSGKIEVSPGKPNEAPGNQGRPINTVPSVFQPRDSGTRITSGRVGADEEYPSGPMGAGWG